MEQNFYNIKLFFILKSVLLVFLGIFYFPYGEILYVRCEDITDGHLVAEQVFPAEHIWTFQMAWKIPEEIR